MSVFRNINFKSVHNYVSIDKDMLLKLFGVVKGRSPAPDGIRGQVLNNCAIQLSDLFHFIFQQFLILHKVPCPWKNSVIVSVPIIKIPKSLSDFKPVALTNLVIKTLKVSKGCTLGHGTG